MATSARDPRPHQRPPSARVITWNVARRSTQLADQALVLAGRAPDAVALQEVTGRTLPMWRAALATVGLTHVRCSLEEADPRREPAGRRRTGVLLASRTPLLDVRLALPVPWPETATAARAATPVGPIKLYAVHVPNAANGRVKIDTLRAIRRGLSGTQRRSSILLGDLNTPRRESASGEVMSFARDSRGRLRPDRGSEWDEAELGVVPRLAELGFQDAFRTLHGYAQPEPSWTWRQIAGHGGGWRIDHAFVSSDLRVVACRYHHDWREEQLSDHAALEVDVAAGLRA